MSKSISPNEAEDLAQTQIKEYVKVGPSATNSTDLIHKAHEAAKALKLKPLYIDHPNIRFVWEFLDLKDQSAIFRSIVDKWVETEGNVQRAAQHVKRSVRSDKDPWSAYGVFRMKAREGPNWSVLDDHGRKDKVDPDPHNPLPQTVIFIALTRLNHANGFFMLLEPGQDVCIDSRAKLLYPPTAEGGMGLAIWLRL